MNIIIEEIVSSFPILITEEVVQITISDATSYFDLLEVSDINFIGKNEFVPTVNETTRKIELKQQLAGVIPTMDQTAAAGSTLTDRTVIFDDTANNTRTTITGVSSTVLDIATGDSAEQSYLGFTFSNVLGTIKSWLKKDGISFLKGGFSHNLTFDTPTADRNINFRDRGGDVAFTDEITGGVTNLSYTASPTNGTVNSDTGTDATIQLADATNAGLLSPSEKTSIADIPNINTNASDKITVKLSENITKGQAVYISSANGTNIIVSKASNAIEATSSKTLGLLETTGVTNDIVNVITEGFLTGLNTSTATVGDTVWLGTSGNLIYGLASKPIAPAHLVYIGVVSRVHATNGEILIKVQNGFELNEIHDVLIDTLADKQLLSYDSASGLWKNKSVTTADIADSIGKRYQTENQNTYNDATSSIQTQLNAKMTANAWVDFSTTSTVVGFSSFTIKSIYYLEVGNIVFVNVVLAGTSNSTLTTFTVPQTALLLSQSSNVQITDNGVTGTTVGLARINASSNVVNVYINNQTTGFNNVGTKAVRFQLFFIKS